MYLAPFTAMLTTARHIDIYKFTNNKNIADKMETPQTQNLESEPQEVLAPVQQQKKKKKKKKRNS